MPCIGMFTYDESLKAGVITAAPLTLPSRHAAKAALAFSSRKGWVVISILGRCQSAAAPSF